MAAYRTALAAGIGILFVVSLFGTALYLAWQSLSQVNFLYPLWYEVLAIDEHIDRFGPENYYKRGFETTDREQRHTLFAQMLRAINHGGEGLAELSYVTASGERHPLLREPERVHLESVARLIDSLRGMAHLMIALLAASVAAMWRLRLPPPSPLRVLLASGTIVALGGIGIVLYGAEDVFNALHELVFPPGEQWFFYYQESLMTTLLKAPDLFGALSVLLAGVTLGWFGVLLAAVRWGMQRLQRPLGTGRPSRSVR